MGLLSSSAVGQTVNGLGAGGGGSGVSSFNTRTGAVLLTAADLAAELGYTPSIGVNGTVNVQTATIPLLNSGSTYGQAFSENLSMPASGISNTVGIGFRNDLTVTGDGSNVTSGQDVLSGNFTTTWGSSVTPITGTVQTSGGFQAGDYISAYAAGAVFAYQRSIVIHNQLLSNATVNEWDDIQPFINNNYGTITLHITYHCVSDQGIPGGGTITTDDCLKNDDSNRAIVTAGPVDFEDGSVFGSTLMLASQLLAKSNSGSTAPSYSFADNTGAGIYDSGTGSTAGINYAINGSRVYGMNSSQFFNGAQSTGFEIQSGAQGAVIFVPDRANGACGVGASAFGNVSTWACNGGGGGILAWDVAYNGLSANEPFVTQVLGEAATGALPAFSFSDNTGTGIGDSNTGTGMNFSISGTRVYGLNATQFFVNNSTGPELFNASASSSIVIAPNRSAQNAGINSSVAGNVTINASNGTGGSSVNVVDAAYNGVTISQPITASSISTGTGDFLCAPIGGGLISQGVTTCVASDKRVKNDLGVVTPEQAVDRVMALPEEHRFMYKPGYGPGGDHTGWWAQDIAKQWPGVVYRSRVTKLTPDGELVFDRGEVGPDTTTAVKWLVGQVRAEEKEIAELRKELRHRHG